MKRIEDKTVNDLMTHGVVTVPESRKVIDVIRILREGHIHGVMIVNNEGKAVGVISEIDLPKAFGRDLNDVTAKEIMSSPVKTVGIDEKIVDVTKTMIAKNIDRLFVLYDNRFPRGFCP